MSTKGRYTVGDGEYITPTAVARHRNGICGNGFYVVLFDFYDGTTRPMMATVFDDRHNVAVLAMGPLAEGIVAMGENSWRGDNFEPALRRIIAKYERDEQVRYLIATE